MGKKGKKYWIPKDLKKGALRRWAKRNAKKIAQVTHSPVFTKSGEINTNTLMKLRKTKWYKRLSPTTKRRINLAINFEKMRKG